MVMLSNRTAVVVFVFLFFCCCFFVVFLLVFCWFFPNNVPSPPRFFNCATAVPMERDSELYFVSYCIYLYSFYK